MPVRSCFCALLTPFCGSSQHTRPTTRRTRMGLRLTASLMTSTFLLASRTSYGSRGTTYSPLGVGLGFGRVWRRASWCFPPRRSTALIGGRAPCGRRLLLSRRRLPSGCRWAPFSPLSRYFASRWLRWRQLWILGIACPWLSPSTHGSGTCSSSRNSPTLPSFSPHPPPLGPT